MANALKEIEHAQRLCDRGDITIGEYFDLVEKWEDAEPIKHGHNIADGHFSKGYDNTSARIFLCSECGYGFDDIYLCNERDYPIEPNYCPNCGARMDLIGEDKSHPFAESVIMGMDGGENESSR